MAETVIIILYNKLIYISWIHSFTTQDLMLLLSLVASPTLYQHVAFTSEQQLHYLQTTCFHWFNCLGTFCGVCHTNVAIRSRCDFSPFWPGSEICWKKGFHSSKYHFCQRKIFWHQSPSEYFFFHQEYYISQWFALKRTHWIILFFFFYICPANIFKRKSILDVKMLFVYTQSVPV